MATPFSDIYELCMTSIRDYKIDQLFDATDLTNFENLMFGFMKKAIPKFIHCKKQLDQINRMLINMVELLSKND
jgi:hypothetical protein